MDDIDKNTKKASQELEFAFLSDQPLKTEDELSNTEFGHKEIAGALTKAIQKCISPFTIGLFGGWGSGKSSIINLLQNNLESNSIPVVIFDVWKHQEDALRRTFLRELLRQLKNKSFDSINKDFEIDERLDKNIETSDSKPTLDFPWHKIAFFLLGFVGVFLLVFAGDGAFNHFRYVRQIWEVSIISIGSVVLLTLAAYITKSITFLTGLTDFILSRFVSSKATTYSIDKFEDPQDFEAEFGKLINALLVKRLVVIFDNLDRVEHIRAIEVLTTIKTFLEPKDLEIQNKDVVFLIPVDADAIRKHINHAYGTEENTDSAFSPDEFLRKFFNAVFWIPDFIPIELEAFTRKMLKDTKVPDLDNEKVAWIITKAYRKNPRQIKQFINILLANYLLVQERQGEGKDFPDDFLPENIPQLTKYLLLNQLFPEEMQAMREARVVNIKSAIEIKTDLKKLIDFDKETVPDIPISDFRIFFTLRRSKHEKIFAGIDDFFTNLEDKQTDKAVKYLEGIEDYEKRKEEFSLVIKERFNNIGNALSLANSISTVLDALDRSGFKLTETGYSDIYHQLTDKAKDYLYLVKPYPLSRQIVEVFSQFREGIVAGWVKVLVDQKGDQHEYQPTKEYLDDLVNIIVHQIEWFIKREKEIQQIFVDHFSQSIWVGELIKDKKAVQRKVLNTKAMTGFINSFSHADVLSKDFSKKIDILLNIDDTLLNVESYKGILTKLTELIDLQNQKGFSEETELIVIDFLKSIQKILKSRVLEFEKLDDVNSWESFVNSIFSGLSLIPEWNARKLYMATLVTLTNFKNIPRLQEIESNVQSFISEANIDAIQWAINEVDDDRFITESKYAPNIESRAMKDQEVFDYFYGVVTPIKKTDLLLNLLKNDSLRLLTKLEQEHYKIPDPRAITEKLLESLGSFEIPIREKIFKAINAMKCGKSKELKDDYVDILVSHLTNPDLNIQKIGYEALDAENFLGKKRNRAITKQVFDWLKKPEVSDKYQPSAVMAIHRGYQDNLNDEEKKDYVQFLFDELIGKGYSEKAIDFGFHQLSILKPRYENRSKNFNDIKSRIENGENEEIKMSLLRGLKQLAPKRTAKGNKRFWDWVISQ